MTAMDWGLRLSDRIRLALEAGDPADARRLALEGDGQTRGLAKEYALMYQGLGITLRVLLRLLRDLPGDAQPTPLRRRFAADMLLLMEGAYGSPSARALLEACRAEAGAGAPPDPEAETARVVRLLEAGEALFAAEQARLAREAVEAMEATDIQRARALLDEKERGQYLPLHDRIVRFMAEVFGLVLVRHGPAGLLRFHLDTAEGQRAGFEKWEGLGAAEFARASAFLLKQHMGMVAVREDDEKFTIEQTPCGSGGRLRLSGAYAGPGALPLVEGPEALTLGQPHFPVYCSHCPVWNGVAPIQWFGRPHWVFENPSRPDGSCTLHIYKRRDGAPGDYARRLGLAEDGPRGDSQ